MTAHYAIVALVALQRLAEVMYARRNARRLLADGGHEVGAAHYPLFVTLHAAWLTALLLAVPAAAPVHLGWLAAFIGLQAMRVWIIATLGRYWTTRIITVAGAPLVRTGPYRYLRHPNYAVVIAEVAVLPFVFGAWNIALLFTAFNVPLILHRIHVENAALAARR